MYSIKKYLEEYIYKTIKKRGKTIIRKDTIEWLLYQLLDKKIIIDEWANDTILNDYRFDLIQHNDVILDIGAGNGLYSLLSSLIAKKVYAIEPILNPEYIVNNPKIELLPYAFGMNMKNIKSEYWGKEVFIKTKNLTTILEELDNKITVIKCDCEGCEWDGFLGCRDLKGIRMIDLEYHLKKDKKLLKELMSLLKSKGFSVIIGKGKRIGMLYAQR